MWPLEWLVLQRLRRALFGYVEGRVLEIGAGTGANLPYFGERAQLVAVDMCEEMLHAARRRTGRERVAWLTADVQRLPFASDSYDYVTGALLFCSIREPQTALDEILRVLRPGGWLLLLEHVRGEGHVMRRMTDWLDHPWCLLSRSCHLNRDTARAVSESGLQLVSATRHSFGVVQTIVARKP